MIRISRLLVSVCVLATAAGRAGADPAKYEPGLDPGLGFNLISWQNFGATGATVWQNAVQDMYNNGFRHVSISPVRYFNATTGAIAPTSAKGPELSHIAAGIARAKSLGMTVTVNPFVEYENFTQWRANWNPSGAVQTQFWTDYQQYLVDVATVAQANGADRMTVGTEMKGLTTNLNHVTQWGNAIAAVNAQFNGPLGYAANWDEYNHSNVINTIWENSAIDFVGIDAYFSLATKSQANGSGAYDPNNPFITTIANKWSTLLKDTIRPFAQQRKGGAGMPIIFTEHGLIPYNYTTYQPYSQSPNGNATTTDQDEQVMGYAGLTRGTDLQADVDNTPLLEIDIWHWGMPGATGSYWYLNPHAVNDPGTTFDETLGIPAAEWLSGYAKTAPEPGTVALLATGLAFGLLLVRGRARRRAALRQPVA